MFNPVLAHKAPNYNADFVSWIKDNIYDNWWVSKENTLINNVKAMFYPWGNGEDGWNRIYNVVKELTLWVMIVYIVWAWATLLFKYSDLKMSDLMKMMWNIVYMVLWCCLVYWASWLFGDVLNFSGDSSAVWLSGMSDKITWAGGAFFQILAAIKWFAFFLAILMIVVTWVRMIAAWEQDKWKKLVKWIINVVVALVVIKWIDFIYYMAVDSETFISEASTFIINTAKLFGYLYWIVIVIMIFLAWYFYLTDWGGGNWFKKACNILVNIVLSGLVLFSFLLILYQVFAEFWPWWSAVTTV